MGHVLVHRSPLQGDPDRFDTDMLHARVAQLVEALSSEGSSSGGSNPPLGTESVGGLALVLVGSMPTVGEVDG